MEAKLAQFALAWLATTEASQFNGQSILPFPLRSQLGIVCYTFGRSTSFQLPMQQNRHPVAVNSILRSLRHLEDCSCIPIAVPAETEEFVRSLILCDNTDKALFLFLFRLPLPALENELLKIAAPSQHLARLLALHDEHVRRAIEKENAVADQNFKLGAECRDKQYEIIDTIAGIISAPINIMPFHLTTALKSLGFNGNVTTAK